MICIKCSTSMVKSDDYYVCPKCGHFTRLGGCPICGYPQIINGRCIACGFELLLLEGKNEEGRLYRTLR